MSIMWKYLDKRRAAVQVIKDYSSMKFILDHTDEKIKEEQIHMTGLGSPSLDGMPHAHNPQAGEEKLVNSLNEIDILKERYRQAVEYMRWFVPAWKQLSNDEQYVLDAFYDDDSGYGSGAAEAVARSFHIEATSAYKKKSRALDHLTVLLFGKE